MSLSSLYSNAFWRKKCVEPAKRKFEGNGIGWAVHRFEIKGGISLRDAMIRDMAAPNPMMDLIRVQSGA